MPGVYLIILSFLAIIAGLINILRNLNDIRIILYNSCVVLAGVYILYKAWGVLCIY
jgi:hypothetical protein